MEVAWIHTLTTIGTILTMMVGSVWSFYLITSPRIDRLDTLISSIDENHRKDLRYMDEKWERLFERLLVQDKK
jgi:hypothetical protein